MGGVAELLELLEEALHLLVVVLQQDDGIGHTRMITQRGVLKP
jgi:hypothetical protein